ncbi:hypothetical protein GCM10023340_14290 [Nocardioides marinquilinus]|uniref:Uncharacterized protein n=1 Tax=Nocardioides marinquilinus TaxID=1210400 RepID=A0ABP9PED6_9ACTN
MLTHGLWLGFGLGVVATLAGAWALPPGWSTRLPFALGWVAVLGYTLLPQASGGYLIAADVRGYALMALGLVTLVAAVVTVRPEVGEDAGAS